MTGLTAGVAYFAVVFAAGFVLGALRVLVVAPAIGALAAVLVELPVMLGLSWGVAGAVLRRLAPDPGLATRATMAATAFALLMLAEPALAILAFGQAARGYLAGLVTLPGAIGLAGQVVFGLIPLLRRH